MLQPFICETWIETVLGVKGKMENLLSVVSWDWQTPLLFHHPYIPTSKYEYIDIVIYFKGVASGFTRFAKSRQNTPPQLSSYTRHNPPICNCPLYIAVTLKPIMGFANLFRISLKLGKFCKLNAIIGLNHWGALGVSLKKTIGRGGLK